MNTIMNTSFCKSVVTHKFYKCLSVSDDICYVFTGDNPYIKSCISKITSNNKKGNDDYFKQIKLSSIIKLYHYLTNKLLIENDISQEDETKMKEYITNELYLNKYSDRRL